MPEIYETEKLDEALDIIQDENKRFPFILHGCDIGPCREKWTSDYLASKVGPKSVRIHVSKDAQMDFVRKNFSYDIMPFDTLVKRCENPINEEFYYFRALAENQRNEIAQIEKDFPTICEDFRRPEVFPAEKFFSSVLRIGSSETQLWTHYDIMDNVLVQVRGRKRLILFPPSDVDFLYVDGDKSLVNDLENIDYQNYPLLKNATFYTGFLSPGDSLFIPALWFHNVKSLESWTISVNIFWRNLESEFYDPNDVYGNKDLVPFSKSIGQLAKSLNELKKQLPPVYFDFYARRLGLFIDKTIETHRTKK